MAINLPAVVAAYFQAENAHDAAGVAQCFSADGEVRDEHHVHRGRAAITEWKRASSARYAATVAPLACTLTAEGCVARGEVSGNFPGSPVLLDFAFNIDAAKITVLEITP